VDLPETWAPQGHVLREPWMRPEIRTGIAELIADLEGAGPDGLGGMRRRFRDLGRTDSATAVTQLLDVRFEMLVASQLARAGALRKIRSDTPDFDCRWDGSDLGVEATTRAREEIGAALERAMEQGPWGDADVQVTLTRTGTLLFSVAPALIAETSDEVIAQIKDAVAAAGGRPAQPREHSDTGVRPECRVDSRRRYRLPRRPGCLPVAPGLHRGRVGAPLEDGRVAGQGHRRGQGPVSDTDNGHHARSRRS